MGLKRKDYDDDELVLAIARGDKTYRQICGEFGISKSLVFRIVRGQARPELLPRIQAAVQAFVDEAHRLAAGWARQLLAKHIAEGMQGDGEAARKCREYVLNLILAQPAGHVTNITLAQSQDVHAGDFLESLPQDQRQRILDVLGGPDD